jgi:Flp pilus assembly protein TadB
MNGPLEWIAAIGTMLAAALIAADLGRKVTGWGFVLFCAVSVTWIVSGLTSNAIPIAAMNAILLAVNAWGVWQFLLNPRKKKVIERVEKAVERIEREVEAEEGA